MMRLNIGCGSNYVDGWVNVDVNEKVYADVHADAALLRMGDSCAEMVYLGHVLEYVHVQDATSVLTEARRLLEPGGLLCVAGPNVGELDKTNTMHLHSYVAQSGVGYHRYLYNMHIWPWVASQLYPLVGSVFPNSQTFTVGDLTPEWPIASQAPWQYAVLAFKER